MSIVPSWRRASIAALAALMLAGAAHGAPGTAPTANAAESRAADVAPVVLDGYTLFKVRGISALPAEQRADDIAARIAALARDPAFSPRDLSLEDKDDRTNVMAGSQRVLAVFDADATAEGVEGHHVIAEIALANIAAAIERYRAERGTASLGQQALRALVAAAIGAALLVLIRLAALRLARLVHAHYLGRLAAVEAKSHRLLTAEQLERTIEGAVHALRWLLFFVVGFTAVAYLLSLFPWTRIAAVRVTELLLDPLRTMWHGILAAIPGLAFILVLAVVTRYVLRALQVFFAGIAGERISLGGFAPEWAWPTYRLARVAVIAFAVIIAYPYIPGSGSDAFKGVSIFFGLLMSLGAASAVANSLAGYALIYRRSFKVGDRIRVGDLVGEVVEMRQQVTELRTIKNEIVTIPSATMLTSQMTNYSAMEQGPGLILHTTVGIGYETPWRQVEAMLLLAAARTPELKRDPAPFVLQTSLGDFAVNYELNAYCDHAKGMEHVYTSMHRNILDVFNEFGVAIMTPAYMADPPSAKVVPPADWFLAPAKAPDSPVNRPP